MNSPLLIVLQFIRAKEKAHILMGESVKSSLLYGTKLTTKDQDEAADVFFEWFITENAFNKLFKPSVK